MLCPSPTRTARPSGSTPAPGRTPRPGLRRLRPTCASRPARAARTASPSTRSGGRCRGRGRIWSYVFPHPPLLPDYAAQAPYNVIVVELAERPAHPAGRQPGRPRRRPAGLGGPGPARGSARAVQVAFHHGRRGHRGALAAGAAVTRRAPSATRRAASPSSPWTGPSAHNAHRPGDRRRTAAAVAGVPLRRRRPRGGADRRGRPGVLHRHRPRPSTVPAAVVAVLAWTIRCCTVGPEGQRPVEAGRRRRQRHGVRRRLLPPRRGRVRHRRRARHLLRPAHHATAWSAPYEPIHMAQRMPYGEVMRMSLMGTAERRRRAAGLRDRSGLRGRPRRRPPRRGPALGRRPGLVPHRGRPGHGPRRLVGPRGGPRPRDGVRGPTHRPGQPSRRPSDRALQRPGARSGLPGAVRAPTWRAVGSRRSVGLEGAE